jgi:hypothetical protein
VLGGGITRRCGRGTFLEKHLRHALDGRVNDRDDLESCGEAFLNAKRMVPQDVVVAKSDVALR